MSARIVLCGRFEVELAGRRVEQRLPGRQGPLVIALLTLNRDRPVRRDELIEALWPARPPADPDDVLNALLSKVRHAIGKDVLTGRRELTLELPDADVDVERAVRAGDAARAAAAAGDWESAAKAASEAAEIGGRTFLVGHDLPWVEDRRRDMEEVRRQALEIVAEAGIALGGRRLAGAEAAARELVRSAPLRESGHRLLIEALDARGEVATAVAAYEELRVLLRDELGMAPGEAVRVVHERLLRGEPATPPGAGRRAGAAPGRPGAATASGLPDRLAQAVATPLVGRAEPLARLTGELDRARAGRTGLVLVTGEGGIGKTRLLAAVAASAADFDVLYGRCDEEQLFPFGPWIELLGGHLARLPDAELSALLGASGAELARLLPDLRARVPGLPEPEHGDPESERRRLFSAVVDVVGRLAARGPLVIMIDDLHWADRSSLLLGRQVARTTELGPVLMLGSYRDTELGEHHPLIELMADLERDQPLERVRLDGLDDDEVAELAGVDGHGLDASAARAVREETHGNPFFVRQLLRHRAEAGDASAPLSAGLRDVIARRVARLPKDAGRVLRVAALMGRDFELDVLESVLDLPDDRVLDALDAAVRAGILVEVESAPGRYSFVHALLRTALESELTATRRARLHRTIGAALEARHEGNLEPYYVDLARHFGAAGPEEVERALRYGVLAADLATRRLAYEEAVELLAEAVGELERHMPGDDERHAELLARLAAARRRAGAWDDARATYARAAEAARRAGAAPLFAQAALGHSGGSWERFGQEDPESLRLLEDARELLPAEDSPLRVRVGARLAAVLYYSPASEERSIAITQEAVAMARRVDDRRSLADALAAAQYAYWRPGIASRRLELATELVEVVEGLGDTHGLAEAQAWLAVALLELCRRDEADAAIARHAELTARLDQPELAVHAAAFRSMQALLEGRWADGERAAMDVLDLGERSTAADAVQYFGVELVALRSEQLRLGELSEHFEGLVREMGALPGWRTPLAWAYAQSGRTELARAELDALRRDDFAALPWDANYDAALGIVTHAVAELGDAEMAAQLEPLLRPLERNWVVLGPGPSTLGPMAYCLGLCSLLLERWDQAERDFELAIERCEAMRAEPYLAHSRLGLAKALRARGAAQDADRAAALEEAAVETGRRLGMARLLRDAPDAVKG
jgi:DNA-binding SARP family transcriptional activator